jgi:hypothetical protein
VHVMMKNTILVEERICGSTLCCPRGPIRNLIEEGIRRNPIVLSSWANFVLKEFIHSNIL